MNAPGRWRWVTIALAALVFAAALEWGTFAVGGSDSYCYAHQAEGWAHGTMLAVDPLSLAAPWPGADWTFAPAGHVPSPTVRGAVVPMCPAGLSLAMALFMTMGGPGAIFYVVPLFGAVLVMAVSEIGARFSPRVALASAVLAACSPAFLFQLVQPMSDVPAAALWMLAVACATGTGRRSPFLAGLAASGAILVRPNLLPLGFVIGAFLLVRPGQGWTSRLRAAAWFAAGSAPGCLAVGAIQQMLYGSPLSSGYGDFSELFSLDHVAPNLRRYSAWLWQTHSPAWLIAFAAPFVLPGWISGLLLTFVLVNLACYLPYTVFNDWWYLRFLLPAIPLLLVLTVAVVDAIIARLLKADGAARQGLLEPTGLVVWCVTALIAVLLVREARARQVFELAQLESRFVRVGRYVDRRLPANALIITGLESGSVRYYSGRRTITWDALDADWLDGAIRFARERDLEPFILLESWEEPGFRTRFPSSTVGRLDWPPMAEIAAKVRIFRPEDRQRYFGGSGYGTEYVR